MEETKMRKIMFGIIFLLSMSIVTAGWQDYFQKDKIEKSLEDRVNEEEILTIVNSDSMLLNYIQKSDVGSLTIKTEQRSIDIAFKNGKVVKTNIKGDYTVRTTEKNLSYLLDKYNAGDRIKTKDILSSVSIPLGLKLKIVRNLWG